MDEYRDRVNYEWFVQFVEKEKSPSFVNPSGRKNLQHNEAGKTDKYPWFNSEYDWDDEDGYSFTTREFS
jgi:hypothetical protein